MSMIFRNETTKCWISPRKNGDGSTQNGLRTWFSCWIWVIFQFLYGTKYHVSIAYLLPKYIWHMAGWIYPTWFQKHFHSDSVASRMFQKTCGPFLSIIDTIHQHWMISSSREVEFNFVMMLSPIRMGTPLKEAQFHMSPFYVPHFEMMINHSLRPTSLDKP